MPAFVIEPHFRLQEWVAHEKGYFTQEGLDYVFRGLVQSTDGRIHDQGDRVGAYQSLEAGRAADVSCACHWTVGVAAAAGHGKLYPDAYSVAPAGISSRPARPSGRRTTWPACRSRSATSPAAITRRSRRSSSTCPPIGSTCPSTTGCSSVAWSS